MLLLLLRCSDCWFTQDCGIGRRVDSGRALGAAAGAGALLGEPGGARSGGDSNKNKNENENKNKTQAREDRENRK